MRKYYESMQEYQCPKCGKWIADWGDNVVDGSRLYREFSCECGLFAWVSYRLQYIGTAGYENTEESETEQDLPRSA